MSNAVLSLRGRFARNGGTASSILLPEAFTGFEDVDVIHVLDIGAGRGRTLDALQKYRCRIYFLDLFDEYPHNAEQPCQDEDEAYEAFARIFAAHNEAMFDVCLFWDFLNLLSLAELRGFSRALYPYTYSGTKGHGVCALFPFGPEANCDYKITELDELQMVPGRDRSYQTWSSTDFAANFDCLPLHCDAISKHGRLEYMLWGEAD